MNFDYLNFSLVIFVNFKTYARATGKKAVILAKICQKVALESGIDIIPCLQTADIFRVCQIVKIPVWAQGFAPVEPRRHTGLVTAYALKKAGATGSLLNHSENPLESLALKKALKLAKKEGLKTLVFTKSARIGQKIDKLKPDFIALEDPKLIGGKTAMVEIKENLKIIKEFTLSLNFAKPIIGAGIKTRLDVKKSLSLDIFGVALSSGIVLSKNPEKILKSLTQAFR